MKNFFLLFFLTFSFSCNLINEKNRNQDPKPIVNKINRAAYEVQYTSDWHIDTIDKDFDIDSYFSLEAPVDDGFYLFVIYNTSVDEEQQVSSQVKAQLNKGMKNGLVTYFDNWGDFKGHGAIMKGKVMGVWKGEIKIFCHSENNCSFLTVAHYLDNDKEIVMPGLNLIESSFKLKK